MNRDPDMGRPADLDLGGGVRLWWTSWNPDRDLNPQYADLPDVERVGAIITHPGGPEGTCFSGITFRGLVSARVFPEAALWDVTSFEPLTLAPSILCRLCGWHVFIREGKVVTC